MEAAKKNNKKEEEKEQQNHFWTSETFEMGHYGGMQNIFKIFILYIHIN